MIQDYAYYEKDYKVNEKIETATEEWQKRERENIRRMKTKVNTLR